MKAKCVSVSPKYWAIVLMPLLLIGLWSASNSRADATATASTHGDTGKNVQDKHASPALDLKLLLHRPGWASPSVVRDGSS